MGAISIICSRLFTSLFPFFCCLSLYYYIFCSKEKNELFIAFYPFLSCFFDAWAGIHTFSLYKHNKTDYESETG